MNLVKVSVRNINDNHLKNFDAKFIREEITEKMTSLGKDRIINHIYEISEENLEKMKMGGKRSLDYFYGITILD
jgi:hypothetical protein